MIPKSGFMLGFGEEKADILRLMDDLAAVSCRRLTIGQYQQPTLKHWPVAGTIILMNLQNSGDCLFQRFEYVESGPLVRSSYRAAHAKTGKQPS